MIFVAPAKQITTNGSLCLSSICLSVMSQFAFAGTTCSAEHWLLQSTVQKVVIRPYKSISFQPHQNVTFLHVPCNNVYELWVSILLTFPRYFNGGSDNGHHTLYCCFMPQSEWLRAYCFLSFLSVCLSLCLSVCLYVVKFILHYIFWTVRDRYVIFDIHAYDVLPSDTNVNYFVTKNCAKNSFLVHLSRRLKCTIVITRCPLSVIRPSSIVTFSHFRLLLWNHWTEFKENS